MVVARGVRVVLTVISLTQCAKLEKKWQTDRQTDSRAKGEDGIDSWEGKKRNSNDTGPGLAGLADWYELWINLSRM